MSRQRMITRARALIADATAAGLLPAFSAVDLLLDNMPELRDEAAARTLLEEASTRPPEPVPVDPDGGWDDPPLDYFDDDDAQLSRHPDFGDSCPAGVIAP